VNFCPAEFISTDELELIDMSRLMKKGILPGEGGYMSQQWRLMELLKIVSSEIMSEERRAMGMLFPLFQLMG